jgi:SOS-response transcriptional repressor LexA
MKKIDILNFITDFRKSPNAIRTHTEILNHLGVVHQAAIDQMLTELQQTRVIRQTEVNGEKAYQVISR